MEFIIGVIVGLLASFVIRISTKFAVGIAAAAIILQLLQVNWPNIANISFGNQRDDPVYEQRLYRQDVQNAYEQIFDSQNVKKLKDNWKKYERKAKLLLNQGSSWGSRSINNSNYSQPAEFTGPISIHNSTFIAGLSIVGQASIHNTAVNGGLHIRQGEVDCRSINADSIRFSGKLNLSDCTVGEIIIEGDGSELSIARGHILNKIICTSRNVKVNSESPYILSKIVYQDLAI